MDEFTKQKDDYLQRTIGAFNQTSFADLRGLYMRHWNEIVEILNYVKNPKLALEDIALLEPDLTARVYHNRGFLQHINAAMMLGKISLNDLA